MGWLSPSSWPHELQPWMLGTVEPSGRYKVESDYKSWFGDMRVGDDVVDVVKLDPICPGSRVYLKTDRVFPVFVEDIRMIKIDLEDKTRGRGADQRTRYVLPDSVKAKLDTIMYQ